MRWSLVTPSLVPATVSSPLGRLGAFVMSTARGACSSLHDRLFNPLTPLGDSARYYSGIRPVIPCLVSKIVASRSGRPGPRVLPLAVMGLPLALVKSWCRQILVESRARLSLAPLIVTSGPVLPRISEIARGVSGAPMLSALLLIALPMAFEPGPDTRYRARTAAGPVMEHRMTFRVVSLLSVIPATLTRPWWQEKISHS